MRAPTLGVRPSPSRPIALPQAGSFLSAALVGWAADSGRLQLLFPLAAFLSLQARALRSPLPTPLSAEPRGRSRHPTDPNAMRPHPCAPSPLPSPLLPPRQVLPLSQAGFLGDVRLPPGERGLQRHKLAANPRLFALVGAQSVCLLLLLLLRPARCALPARSSQPHPARPSSGFRRA